MRKVTHYSPNTTTNANESRLELKGNENSLVEESKEEQSPYQVETEEVERTTNRRLKN